MSEFANAKFLNVQALVRQWRYFAIDEDGIVLTDQYQSGSGDIWQHIPGFVSEDEKLLSLSIGVADGAIDDGPDQISLECEVDGSSSYVLADEHGETLGEWKQDEVPSALLAPELALSPRWTISLRIRSGKIVGWPTGDQVEAILQRFRAVSHDSREPNIGLLSLKD